MFENTVLRRIFGPRRDNVTGKRRKLHNGELSDRYSSPNIVRRDKTEMNEIGGACSANRDRKCVFRVLVGKREGKRPLDRPRRGWEDNIKMDFQEVGCEDMDWIELAQDRERWRALMNAVMNSVGSIKCLVFLG